MTTIHCTQKLLTELRIKPSPADPPNLPNPTEPGDQGSLADASSWHANLLLIDRRKCILFTHDQTLFSFFRCGLTRPDFAQPEDIFGQGLFETLLQFNFNQAEIEQMLEQTREIRWAKSHNRSVSGSMNNMQQMLKWSIQRDGGLANADQADLIRLLNETLFKAIGFDFPVERLRQLLQADAIP